LKVEAHILYEMSSESKPIIIIGAGLVGLTLTQALKKSGHSFQIYDRDGALGERPAGWGITMHWALPALAACLPAEVFAMIPSMEVDPVEGAKGLFLTRHVTALDIYTDSRP
jgi:flavin-dependent dehydrogenase